MSSMGQEIREHSYRICNVVKKKPRVLKNSFTIMATTGLCNRFLEMVFAQRPKMEKNKTKLNNYHFSNKLTYEVS